jgi:hypothetical protein
MYTIRYTLLSPCTTPTRYTLYVVNVVCPAGAAWKLKLRYSEFSSLYLAIKRDCKKTGITFPGKTFGKLSIAQQEKRRLHLKAFLLRKPSIEITPGRWKIPGGLGGGGGGGGCQ